MGDRFIIPRQRGRRLLAVLMVPLAVFGAVSCSSGGSAPAPKAIMDKATPFGDLLVPKLSASVTDGAVGVAVDSPVTVNADDGVLASVEMVNENGGTVEGQLSPDGVRWATTERLGYNRMYTLTAKARGLGGAATRQLTFQTHSPHNLTMPYAMPHDGEVVGIGEPVAIQFDEAIANREAAEKAIVVTTDPPVEGAFYWLNKREVRWRPEHFWKPGTNVNIAVNTYGVDLGDGVFGEDNVRSHFTVGDEVIATADDNTKMVTVRVNGDVVKTMPTSMGKDSTPTASGTYILGVRFAHMIMDSSTYGVPVNSPNGYHRGEFRHPDVLQRSIRAFGAVVGGRPRPHQHQPRLPQREPEQRPMVLREHQARRHRAGAQHARPAAVGDRRARRLEHPMGPVARWQCQGMTPNCYAAFVI